MAKIKSYTDLNQSKKLAEILPIESADMWWLYVPSQGKYIAMMYEEPDPHYLARMKSYYGIKDATIRCWSLAALLDVLKDDIKIEKTLFDQSDMFTYSILGEGYDYRTYEHENLVDACYEMIVKLHEQKIIAIMIKERYVSFEVASLLRDKGFNGDCLSMYLTPKPHSGMGNPNEPILAPHGRDSHYYEGYIYQCEAPTQAMACEWIEKKHHYIIDVHLDVDVESEEASSWVWFVYERINIEGGEPYARLYFADDEPYEFDNQEFAYNDAIKYVLTNLV